MDCGGASTVGSDGGESPFVHLVRALPVRRCPSSTACAGDVLGGSIYPLGSIDPGLEGRGRVPLVFGHIH